MRNFLLPPLFLLFLISIPHVSAHGRMKTPAPLDGPAATDATGNAYNSPLSGTGADFPCKGLHLKPGVDKTPKATWAAGSRAFFELVPNGPGGGEGALAAHSGGSCQASISCNNGVTWKVLHTYQGGCPRGVPYNSNIAGPDQKFEFDIPKQLKPGRCLFAWTWAAVTGNRDEYYMNCASVEITGSGTSELEDYEDMWVGDMDIPGRIKTGECRSKAGFALVYPNPGPFITIKEVSGIPFGPSTGGTCFVGPGKGKSTGSGSSDSGEGTGSDSGRGDSGGDGNPVVTKSEPVATSSPVSSAATSIAKGETTTSAATTPIAGGGGGGAKTTDPANGPMFPTTEETPRTPTATGSKTGSAATSIAATDPANGPMFPTTEEVVAPPRTSKSRAKTRTGAGHKSTSTSCTNQGNDGSGAGTGTGGSATGGSGSGSGSGSGAGSGAGNTTPATTQKPWSKIYTPTTFQTKYTPA